MHANTRWSAEAARRREESGGGIGRFSCPHRMDAFASLKKESNIRLEE
jgi:hypothetical protein